MHETGDQNLKKGYVHILQKVMNNEFIDLIHEQNENYPIQVTCEVLDVSKWI